MQSVNSKTFTDRLVNNKTFIDRLADNERSSKEKLVCSFCQNFKIQL
jgi:hypothetical protein